MAQFWRSFCLNRAQNWVISAAVLCPRHAQSLILQWTNPLLPPLPRVPTTTNTSCHRIWARWVGEGVMRLLPNQRQDHCCCSCCLHVLSSFGLLLLQFLWLHLLWLHLLWLHLLCYIFYGCISYGCIFYGCIFYDTIHHCSERGEECPLKCWNSHHFVSPCSGKCHNSSWQKCCWFLWSPSP